MVLAALKFDNLIYNYGRFHNDRTNQIILFVFVPVLQLTLFVLGAIHGHSLHVSFLEGIVPDGMIYIEAWTLFAVVVAAYFVADFRTAAITMMWSGAMLRASHRIAADNAYSSNNVGGSTYLLKDAALHLHIAGWLVQF